MVRFALVVLAACGAAPAPAPPPIKPPPAKPAEPFPPAPEFRLPHTFEPVRYAAHLAIGETAFSGAIEIEGDLRERASTIWLHGDQLRVSRAQARRGKETIELESTRERDDELIGLRAPRELEPGRWTLVVAYEGRYEDWEEPTKLWITPTPHGALRRIEDGETYIFTNSQPSYARRIFPCIDEPDRKVPWQLTLDVDAGMTALANQPIASERALDGKRKRVVFEPSPPTPSYLVAFAVGPFAIVDAGKTRNGAPLRVVMPKGRAADAAPLVALLPPLVAQLEDYLGMPYPYAKLDIVRVPNLIVAMENPGLITVSHTMYGEPWFAHVIAHELAHQWFGNLVTPRWWDDLWLSESFASWLAHRFVPAHDWFYAPLLPSTKRVVVRRPAATANELARAFEAVDHRPGVVTLHTFERFVGEAAFARALREHLKRHAHRTATTDDFLATFDRVTGQPLAGIFREYLDGDPPSVGVALDCSNRSAAAVLTRKSELAIPVCFAYDDGGVRRDRCVTLDAPSVRVELAMRACPRWLLPAARGHALHVPMVGDEARYIKSIVDHAWPHLTTDERLAVYWHVEPRSRVPLVPVLARDTDLALVDLAARHIASLTNHTHPRFDAWVRKLLEPHASKLSLRTLAASGGPGLSVVEAFALAGGRTHDAEAVELVKQQVRLPFVVERVVLQIAANADRTITEQLFRELAEGKAGGGWVHRLALLASQHTIDLVLADPAKARLLSHVSPCLLLRGLGRDKRDQLLEALKSPSKPIVVGTCEGEAFDATREVRRLVGN